MDTYTVHIKVVSTDLDDLEEAISDIRDCNSDTVNCEIGKIREED